MKVLFFSAWYPHRYDAMAGLFVRKHAEAAAAQGEDVAVFYLQESPSDSPHSDTPQETRIKGVSTGSTSHWVEQETNGVREFYFYYSAKNCLDAYLRFWKGFLDGYKHIEKSWGRPDITQVNVVAKNAWCAYYLWKKYQIPYVVVEHWSGYLPANGSYKGWLNKRITKLIVHHAKSVHPVSPMLMEAMQKHGLKNQHYELINNVVDDFFAAPHPPKGGATPRDFTFLHVSCFDEAAKNTCGILRAVAALRKQRQDFRLIMVGTGQDIQLARDTATQLGLTEEIVGWTGEVTPQQVADYMREADCFVLFSNYENAPVVLSECLAVGLPIISSCVGFVPQVVTEDVGRIVEPKDEQQLTQTMYWMIDHAKEFDRNKIRQHGYAYSYEAVGKQLHAIYQLIDTKNK